MARTSFLHQAIVAMFVTLTAIFCHDSAYADVEIIRDKSGMAHVYGNSNYDLFYGFGYISARDRLFQMESRRRQALGTAAEVFGEGHKRRVIASDRDKRTKLDLPSQRAQYEALPVQDKDIILAFTDGINAAIEEIMQDPEKRLPKPFFDFGFMPALWTVEDTVAVSVDILGAYSAFTTQRVNMKLYNFLQTRFPRSCDDIFDQFLWLSDPNAPTTMMDHQDGGADPEQTGPKGCAKGSQTVNGLQLGGSRLSLDHIVKPQTEPRRSSMSWSVGSNKAIGFKSIFLTGPQPGWNSPSVYYPIALHGGDFDVVGWAAAGSFVVRMGASRHFSWASTSGLSSQMDTYQETLSADRQSYRFQNGWKPVHKRTETINVHDKADVTLEVRRTHHGPIVADDKASGLAYTEQVAWRGNEVASVMAWLHSAKARTFDQWLGYMRQIDFNYNIFYTDREGSVGFAHTGHIPLRKPQHDFRLPASGEGNYEWVGRLPAEQNPHAVNKDYIINFNNKPTRNWPNTALYWEQWSSANQASIPIKLFNEKQKFTWDDIWEMNRIVTFSDVNAPHFIPYLVKAGRNIDPNSDAGQAIALLAAWNMLRMDEDGDQLIDHPGQTIFDAWLPIMVRNTLGPTLEGFDGKAIWVDAGYQTGLPRLEEHPTAGTLTLQHALLNSEGKSGVQHYHDFFNGQSADSVILRSLTEALAELRKEHKGPMNSWRTRITPHFFFDTNMSRIPITSPDVTFQLPVYMNRGAVNMQTAYGSDGTVRVGYVSPPGVVGHISPDGKPDDSPYFSNHLGMYRNFGLFEEYFDKEDVLSNIGADGIVRLDPRKGKAKL